MLFSFRRMERTNLDEIQGIETKVFKGNRDHQVGVSAAIRGARTAIKQDEMQGGDSRFLGGTGRCFEKTVSEKGA